jgi:hypothetical protein
MKPSHKSIKSSKNKKLVEHRLKSRVLYMSGVALLLLSVITYHGVAANYQPAKYIVAVTKSVHRRIAPPPKPVKVTPTSTSTKPNYIVATITPTPTTSPIPKTDTPAPTKTIVPSPNSNVSGLTPVTTPPPSGGGPGGSSGYTGVSDGANAEIKYTTTNWSGYLEDNGPYTGISGSWFAPSVTGNGASTSADATWIGIGGVTTGDLIQVGTQDIVGANGQVTLYAFYEGLPGLSQSISGLAINAGDKIDASLTETSPDVWDISIADVTDGQSFSSPATYASTGSSAEWIEEDPQYAGGRQISFDNFGFLDFTDALATVNGVTYNLTTGDAQSIAMVDRFGDVIAIPSVFTSNGTGFSVTQSGP